jgi:translocation and assembly module TamA
MESGLSERPSRDTGLQRSGLALAVAAAALMWGAEASAVTRRAVVLGVQDRALKTEIEIAIGDEKTQPANRVDARRRARQAADSASALLRSEGYYDYEVDPDIGEGDRPQSQVTIEVGPRTLLAPPVIHWTDAAPSQAIQDAVLKALALKPGAPARAADVVAAEGRIVAITQEKGYADAKAAPREVVVDHADQTLHATFNITAGALVRLDGLKVDGKSRTRRAWLQKLVPWKTDEVYTPKALAELERRLLETGVYESVTVSLTPKPNPDGLRPVVVALADRSRHSFELGAGYSTTEGGDIDLKLSSYNPFGQGDTVTYEARYATGVSEIGSKVGVLLSLPHFLHPGQTLTVEPSFFQNVTTAYTETGPRITADLTQRYGKTSFITGGASVTQSRVDDKETGTINILTFRLLGAFALDRSDNPLDPRSGYRIDARAEPTQIEGDEQLLYLKLQAEGTYYLPLDLLENTVVAVRGHIGSIIGGKIPSVPASDRFFAGGGGSVRGYAYQTVGPHYLDNTPVGGLSLVEGSVELRQRFTQTLGGVVFFDTGSVGGQIQPDFRHTDAAVGVGFRYNLGFAPIRADLAFPLQKPNGASQQPFQVYLSIGQAF